MTPAEAAQRGYELIDPTATLVMLAIGGGDE
jgi:hypothetical protein